MCTLSDAVAHVVIDEGHYGFEVSQDKPNELRT
jgi:hypothetical protein